MITIKREQLKSDAGMILLKNDGDYKIIYGVHTDVDLAFFVETYFNIQK